MVKKLCRCLLLQRLSCPSTRWRWPNCVARSHLGLRCLALDDKLEVVIPSHCVRVLMESCFRKCSYPSQRYVQRWALVAYCAYYSLRWYVSVLGNDHLDMPSFNIHTKLNRIFWHLLIESDIQIESSAEGPLPQICTFCSTCAAQKVSLSSPFVVCGF